MIETNQELYLTNLLSFRKQLTQAEVQNEMNSIESFIKENNLTVVGPKISTTYSVTQSMTPTMDIEILIPVDKEFNGTDLYKLKKEFKLTHCLKVSHKGNPATFQNTIINLQNYIQDNKLMPISSLYTVNIKEAQTQEEIESFQADTYVSISPNIL
ncbi:MAG: transcriptional regulator [Clostridium beijerinckii]|nr:transcriptional regulator [Clostridium beijerinckii]